MIDTVDTLNVLVHNIPKGVMKDIKAALKSNMFCEFTGRITGRTYRGDRHCYNIEGNSVDLIKTIGKMAGADQGKKEDPKEEIVELSGQKYDRQEFHLLFGHETCHRCGMSVEFESGHEVVGSNIICKSCVEDFNIKRVIPCEC